MTREEQIKQAAQCATNHGSSCNNYAYLNFIEGAEWADSHPNGSVIRWQTGEPTEESDYITMRKNSNGDTYVAYNIWHLGRWFAEACDYSVIIAWCKLSDVKPYKEV